MAKDMMGQCSPKCIVLGLVAAAFAAGGLWMVVAAIINQWNRLAPTSNIFLWYFGGFVLFAIAKMMKMKCCNFCRMA
jgi:hypothetical protein